MKDTSKTLRIYRLVILILYFLLPSAFSAFGSKPASFESSATQLFTAYQSFANQDINELTMAMEALDAKLIRKVSFPIEPSGVVDSIIFEGKNMTASFVSVDIDYIRNISVIIKTDTEDSKNILDVLVDMYDKKGFESIPELTIAGVCTVYKDFGHHWVVDRRFKEPTFTNFSSLYEHMLTTYGNELVLNLNQTFPKEWTDQAPEGIIDHSPEIAANLISGTQEGHLGEPRFY